MGQTARGWITILWMCMSRVALRWNDLCHVCGTTSGWWLQHTQPRAALVQSRLTCLHQKETKKTKTLGVFSFTDFSLPRTCMRPLTVTQSRRLGTISLQAWPILPHPPALTHTHAHAHVRAFPAPWRGQGQMSRGLYSLRFCRLNQVGWVSSSLPFNGMVIWFFLLMPAAILSSCLGLSPSSASSSVFITVVLWLNYGLWSGSTQPYISPPCCPGRSLRARLASAALPLPAACPVTLDHRGGLQKGAKGKKTKPWDHGRFGGWVNLWEVAGTQRCCCFKTAQHLAVDLHAGLCHLLRFCSSVPQMFSLTCVYVVKQGIRSASCCSKDGFILCSTRSSIRKIQHKPWEDWVKPGSNNLTEEIISRLILIISLYLLHIIKDWMNFLCVKLI